jgi:predicted dehydrogenase
MKAVAIIGAGQLGSRHLQGLKTANNELAIYVMDQSSDSLKLADDRYNQVDDNGFAKEVHFVTSMDMLPTDLDVVIIATGSIPRAMLTKLLLSHSKVKYLILEKILFPRLAEYEEIKEVIIRENVKAWVNCPRRLFAYYQKLNALIDSPFEMTVDGSNWGLCCNSIHLLDIFLYLAKENEYSVTLDVTSLEESKRKGYIEMMGSFYFTTPKGSKLNLHCSKDEKIYGGWIKSDKYDIVIDKKNMKLVINGEEEPIFSYPNSQLTGKVVDQLLLNGDCGLTRFEESCKYHKPIIDAILNEYNRLTGNKGDLCPIT